MVVVLHAAVGDNAVVVRQNRHDVAMRRIVAIVTMTVVVHIARRFVGRAVPSVFIPAHIAAPVVIPAFAVGPCGNGRAR